MAPHSPSLCCARVHCSLNWNLNLISSYICSKVPKTYYIPATHQTRLEFFSFKNKSIVSTAGIRWAPTAHATLCAGRRASGPHLSLPLPSPPLASPSQSSPLPSFISPFDFPRLPYFHVFLFFPPSQGFWPPPCPPPLHPLLPAAQTHSWGSVLFILHCCCLCRLWLCFPLSSFYLQSVFVLGWPSSASGPRQSRLRLCARSLPPPAPGSCTEQRPPNTTEGNRQLADSIGKKANGIGFLGLMPESCYATAQERAKGLVGASFKKAVRNCCHHLG